MHDLCFGPVLGSGRKGSMDRYSAVPLLLHQPFCLCPSNLYLRRASAICYDVGSLLVSPPSLRVEAECRGIARGAIL